MSKQKYSVGELMKRVYEFMNKSWAKNAITISELAVDLNVHKRTAAKYLEQLAGYGFIVKDGTRNDLYWRE